MKKLCFVGHPSRSSGLIRGKQVSERIEGSRFVDATDLKTLGTIRDQVCLIVRQPEPEVARILKKNNNVVGYDLLDRPVSDYHDQTARGKNDGDFDWSRYANSNTDFFVVNNTLAKWRLEDSLARSGIRTSIHVIPHHTVNFGSHKNEVLERPMRVAYVGFPNQFSGQDEIRKVCEANGAKLTISNPQTRDECVELMKLVDIGVIFVEQTEKVPYTLRYKPNTKLSNFQSFGIPTIAVPYASFEEFGGTAWQKATSLDEFVAKLDALLNDFHLRRELSEAGYEHAKRFQIDAVARDYYGALVSAHAL